MTTGKNLNSFKKGQNTVIKGIPIKIESINTNTNINVNNNEKSVKSKYINTYKTFSEISSNHYDTQKNETTLNTTYKKMNENNFLIIEEISNTYRESKNKNNSSFGNIRNSKNYKLSRNKNHETKIEDGLFNGEVLYFDMNGLKYGLRCKKDGYGFFGTSTHYHGKIINDYVLNINNGMNNLSNSIHLRKNSDLSMGTCSLFNEDNNINNGNNNLEERVTKIENFLKAGNFAKKATQMVNNTIPEMNKELKSVKKEVKKIEGKLQDYWPKLVNDFKEQGKMFMYINLEGSVAREINDMTLAIEFPKGINPVAKEFLERADNRQILKDTVHLASGREMQIKYIDTYKNEKEQNGSEFQSFAKKVDLPFNIIE